MSDGPGFRIGLRERARVRPRAVVFPEGDHPRMAEAVAEILREGLLRPVLVGPPEEVRDALAAAGADPSGVAIVDPRVDADRYAVDLLELRRARGLSEAKAHERAREPLFRGALMVRRGEVDGSVAGIVHTTGDVLRAALWCLGPAPGIRTVSSSFYMVVPDFRGRGEEVLTFTDASVVPDPTPQQLADTAYAAAQARRTVVGDEPRLAFLSYSTRGSATGPSIDRVLEGLKLFQYRSPDVPSDGELQADAALVEAIGQRKAPGSRVAGSANVLVFPNLDAGNIAYKLVQRLAGAAAVGPIIQGLARPLNDVSRGASSGEIVEVACITSLMAE